MAFNLNDLTYTITGFDAQGNAIVTFNCDGSSQVLGSCPTDSVESIQNYIGGYTIPAVAEIRDNDGNVLTPAQPAQFVPGYVQAYIAGLQTQLPTQPTSLVQALIGQTITPSGS